MPESAEIASLTETVRVVLFDVFGTVVDYRPALIAGLERYGASQGRTADWAKLADQWRRAERGAMDRVNADGTWRGLDALRGACLDEVLTEHGLAAPTELERRDLVAAWTRGQPWSDVLSGLARLRERYVIGTLSNSTVATLVALSKQAGLPWDCVLSADLVAAYKPAPVAYQRSVGWLAERPEQVMLVAAHQYDLRAAASHGLKTAFVPRPLEAGERGGIDVTPPSNVDLVAADLVELAKTLGCPA